MALENARNIQDFRGLRRVCLFLGITNSSHSEQRNHRQHHCGHRDEKVSAQLSLALGWSKKFQLGMGQKNIWPVGPGPPRGLEIIIIVKLRRTYHFPILKLKPYTQFWATYQVTTLLVNHSHLCMCSTVGLCFFVQPSHNNSFNRSQLTSSWHFLCCTLWKWNPQIPWFIMPSHHSFPLKLPA